MSFIDGTQISSNVVTFDKLAHDELLANIDRSTWISPAHKIALCAVVELHHPCAGDEHDDDPELVNDPCLCKGCSNIDQEYPCKTILVVREALQ